VCTNVSYQRFTQELKSLPLRM